MAERSASVSEDELCRLIEEKDSKNYFNVYFIQTKVLLLYFKMILVKLISVTFTLVLK